MILKCSHCGCDFDSSSQKEENPFKEAYCDSCLLVYEEYMNHKEDLNNEKKPVGGSGDCS